MLSFSAFLKITYPYLADGRYKNEYPSYIASLFMLDSEGDDDINPLELAKSSQSRIFRGQDEVSVKAATIILNKWSTDKFYDAMNGDIDSCDRMVADFEKKGVVFSNESDRIDVIASQMKIILENIAKREKGKASSVCAIDSRGQRIEDISADSIFYDRTSHKLMIAGRVVKVSPSLIPETIQDREMEQPYFKALLEVFSEALGEDCLSLEEISSGNPHYYQEILRNREYFFDAEAVRHVIRDAIIDGDSHFSEYKNEIFEGVIDVHHCSYGNGYERLLKVLAASTSVNVGKARLDKLYLIGGREKKGICHMLVEEGRLHSWVRIF